MKEYIVTTEQGANQQLFHELIRCKDCKHHKGYNCDRLYGMQDAFMVMDDDYCSKPERKDDETD